MTERLDQPQPLRLPIEATLGGMLTGRILLAEDNLDNQRLIAFHLRRAGATVSVADNGLIAFDLIAQAETTGRPFDMLLSDMQMPEMDGYALARAIRSCGIKLPIIAVTAHSMPEDRQRCLDAGCDDYAAKPVDNATLLDLCAIWMKRLEAERRKAA